MYDIYQVTKDGFTMTSSSSKPVKYLKRLKSATWGGILAPEPTKSVTLAKSHDPSSSQFLRQTESLAPILAPPPPPPTPIVVAPVWMEGIRPVLDFEHDHGTAQSQRNGSGTRCHSRPRVPEALRTPVCSLAFSCCGENSSSCLDASLALESHGPPNLL